MAVIMLHFFKFVFENWYTGVFEVTIYESELRFWEFKMADPSWVPEFKICLNLFLKIGIEEVTKMGF